MGFFGVFYVFLLIFVDLFRVGVLSDFLGIFKRFFGDFWVLLMIFLNWYLWICLELLGFSIVIFGFVRIGWDFWFVGILLGISRSFNHFLRIFVDFVGFLIDLLGFAMICWDFFRVYGICCDFWAILSIFRDFWGICAILWGF